MNLDELTIGQARSLAAMFERPTVKQAPEFENPVIAQFIGRFVFVCDLRIEGDYCYLTKVRNVRYWESRDDGLGGLAKEGQASGDKIDNWPNQIIPLDKLGPVMPANKEKWK